MYNTEKGRLDLAFIAFLPILTVLILMMFFNLSARLSLLISWIMAGIFGLIFWKINPKELLSGSVFGMLSSLEVLIIIAGAIFLMNVLKASGATAAINKGFMNINPDKRVQACIIGFSFCSFIEAAAGFGTPAALAGPLMVSLGFPPMAAAMIALIFDSTAVSFGAVGTPVTSALSALGKSTDGNFIRSFSFWTALPHAVVSVFLPLIVLLMTTKLFGREKSFKPALKAAPFALFTGASFAIPMLIISLFMGYEFASLLAALFSVAVTVVAAKNNFLTPKKSWNFGNPDQWEKDWLATVKVQPAKDSEMSLVLAWIPYILVAVILVITRIPTLGIKNLLTSGPFIIRINSILGIEKLDWAFKWAYIPGTIFVLVALVTLFIHKINFSQLKESVNSTVKQVWGAALALLFGLALVEVLKFQNFEGISMLDTMANALAMVGKGIYTLIAPFIGVLGSFVSGSATVSMNLFSNLQYNTALQLGIPTVFAVSMQCVGAAVGNMVCINNAVAAGATMGISGKEGKLIKTNIIPMFIYCILTALLFYIVTALGVKPVE